MLPAAGAWRMVDSSPPAMGREEAAAAALPEENKWEVRPGGMLVQRRDRDSDAATVPIATIRLKVQYSGVYHEIYINSQATFGELKKVLAGKTGLHPEDQKVVFKGKERNPKAFLDTAGVKDRSKLVLLEDPSAKARRLLEQRRTEKMDIAVKSIARIGAHVDKIASKVTALEKIVSGGAKVVEGDIALLTESLMNELVKLDSIAGDGDMKARRRELETRVKKYVETLDAIKVKNAAAAPPPRPAAQNHNHQPPAPATAPMPTKESTWEMFDLLSSMPSTSSSTITTKMAASTTSSSPAAARFDWEQF